MTEIRLAPMAGITDWPFRLLCFEQGCDAATTEMISALGYVYAPKNHVATNQLLEKAPGEGRRRESRASLQGKVRAVRQMPKKWAAAAPAGACRSAAEPPVRMPRRERGPFVRRCFFHSKCPAAFRRADAGVCRAKRRTKTAVRGEGGRKTCL